MNQAEWLYDDDSISTYHRYDTCICEHDKYPPNLYRLEQPRTAATTWLQPPQTTTGRLSEERATLFILPSFWWYYQPHPATVLNEHPFYTVATFCNLWPLLVTCSFIFWGLLQLLFLCPFYASSIGGWCGRERDLNTTCKQHPFIAPTVTTFSW